VSQNQLTKDLVYQAVDPADFPAMMDVDRYGRRSAAFDRIISQTHDHFWDPLDPHYIDFSQPWDMARDMLVQPKIIVETKIGITDTLSEANQVKLVNLATLWSMSSILHGEQGALSLSASLCSMLLDPGAQEYAANQAREEARHVTGFSRYIQARWGRPVPVGPALGGLITELVQTPILWKKIVGMQMLIEGLAMGAFATMHAYGNDPVLVRLCQLVMTDEAFHHKFGKIWADRTIPKLDPAERDEIEDWAWQCFQVLLFNLSSPEQKKWIYAEVGLDWRDVQAAFLAAMTDENIRWDMQHSTNIFRTLVKTLLKAGIITKRTAPNYAAYLDIAELHAEGDEMVGDSIAAQGIEYLRQINDGRRPPRGIAAE
jgi:hypothetical protein